jgi:hypothetical protein
MSTAIVAGSLSAIAQRDGCSLAESFLSTDAIVIVDTSGSMDTYDARGGRQRYQVACDELKRLQQTLPGKLAVISFSSDAHFCPGGVPDYQGGGTDLAGALRFVQVADGCGMRFIVISDGHPDDAREALAEAARFSDRIDTVFVGPEGGGGADFLKRLAAASGGAYSANQMHEVATRVEQLLLAAHT